MLMERLAIWEGRKGGKRIVERKEKGKIDSEEGYNM